jgi:hypothetical protein
MRYWVRSLGQNDNALSYNNLNPLFYSPVLEFLVVTIYELPIILIKKLS